MLDKYLENLRQDADGKEKRAAATNEMSFAELAKVAGVEIAHDICPKCADRMVKTAGILRCACGMMKGASVARLAGKAATRAAGTAMGTGVSAHTLKNAAAEDPTKKSSMAPSTGAQWSTGDMKGGDTKLGMSKCGKCGEEQCETEDGVKCGCGVKVGSASLRALTSGLGAGIGAGTGALAAGEGNRGRGALAGGTAGGVLGAVAPGLPFVSGAGASLAGMGGAGKLLKALGMAPKLNRRARGPMIPTPGGMSQRITHKPNLPAKAAIGAGALTGTAGAAAPFAAAGGGAGAATRLLPDKKKGKSESKDKGKDKSDDKEKDAADLLAVGDAAGRVMAKSAATYSVPKGDVQEAFEGAAERENPIERGKSWGRRGAAAGAGGGGGLGFLAGHLLKSRLGGAAPYVGAGIGAIGGGVAGQRIGKEEGTEEAVADLLVSRLRNRAAGMSGYRAGGQRGYLMGRMHGAQPAGPENPPTER